MGGWDADGNNRTLLGNNSDDDDSTSAEDKKLRGALSGTSPPHSEIGFLGLNDDRCDIK